MVFDPSACQFVNSFPRNAPYMAHSKKFTQELVGKSARVHANIGVSHIDRIVSESPTSSTEWSRHSIIFADAAVHFPNYDLDLLFRPKLLSSVRPRDFARECFFSVFYLAKNITRVGTKFGGFAARVSRSRLSAYRTRELSRAFFCFAPEPTYPYSY